MGYLSDTMHAVIAYSIVGVFALSQLFKTLRLLVK